MPATLIQKVNYLLFESIRWYCEQKHLNLEEFNKSNDFTKDKVMLLPFFVCMGGNGSMQILHQALGPFLARSNGPISKGINDAIEDIIKPDQGEKIIEFSNSAKILTVKDWDSLKNSLNEDGVSKELLSKAFERLRTNMPELIEFNYLELLILCHQFNASYVYRLKHKSDNQISTSDILQERGYYFLAGMLENKI